jgi:hypothetical protein
VDPYSRGARAVGIAFRTAHLFTMAVFVGGVFLAAPDAAVRPWRGLAVATGVALLASEVSHGARTWIWQVRGLAVLAHVAVLALLAVGGADRAAAALAVVVGAAGSHAPKTVRKWSLRHGRVVD